MCIICREIRRGHVDIIHHLIVIFKKLSIYGYLSFLVNAPDKRAFKKTDKLAQ